MHQLLQNYETLIPLMQSSDHNAYNIALQTIRELLNTQSQKFAELPKNQNLLSSLRHLIQTLHHLTHKL